ncbi:MAG: tetratricopeptide repeat protein [Gammaproteobacteria bacterium]|nr:tetratricopeptide repeat protein [Gammaproteobacteria bacterium]
MKTLFLTQSFPAILMGLLLAFSSTGFAAGGNYSSDVDLEPIIALIEQGNYESAINLLHDELDVDPDNPDIMTLLGFSYRKTQNYEDALTFYEWALKAAPRHKGANEYLGELYLETNQLDKAVEQLEILNDLCRVDCKEYTTLKEAIDSFQKTASNS